MAKFYLSLLLLCTAPVLLAQPNEQPVRFANGNFFTGDNIRRNSFRQTALQPTLYNGRYYVLVKFAQLPDEAQQQALQQAGVQLLQYLPGRAYLATIQQRFDFAAAARYGIASINVLPPMYKLDDRIVRYTAIADKTAQPLMAIALLDEAARQPALEALAQLGAAVVPQPLHGPQVIYIRPDTAVAQAMAALPYVGYIHLQATGHHTLNHNSVGAQAISALHNGKNLLGKGVAIGVGDDAEVSSHIDFTGRLINRSFGFANNHGTHVTGTAAGGGLFNPLYRGMAPRATIVSQIYNGIILNAPSYVADHDMVLTNNSYHTGELNCPGNSVYDLNSRLVDAQTLGYGQLLHVVASGNDGAYTCAGYPAAYATIKSGWQCAKNVLTVGAAKIDDYTIAPFSSRGPVKDGRLKPELVANGWAVSSTFPNNNYAWFFGTSMAAPQVTGGLSLLYERYRQLNGGANPSGALVKAVACNSAEDLGNPGPDFTFGFGLLNARRALEALEQNRYFSGSLTNGANAVHTISVPAGARRLKVLLYWMDREALPNAAVTLINDLDLTVSGPGGTVLPLVLNTLPSGVGLPAAPGADHLNNIEQVVIENPGNGDYHININGFAIPQGPQNYVVTYEITNPGVTVEYPYGGETWVPGAVENIRWNAYGNEGNTFTVEYSANNGASWTVLSNAVPATARSYNWATGPATPTDSALIRVTRNGTGLVGQSSRPFVVLGQPVVTAATVCDGAVQLTWPAVTNATGYDIMRMSGDTMRVIGSTSGLSYAVKGLTASNIPNWLAVRAKTANAVGRRSVVASAPVCCGPCTLADFDNDVKAEVILEPTSGREHTQRAFDPEKPVKVRFKNLDDAPISGPMTVAYMVNGAGPYTEIISPTVAAGASFEHTLTRQHPLPLGGPFELAIKAWITRPGDTNPANDTAYAVVKKLDNQLVLGFPVAEGFESTATAEYNAGTMGLQGNDRFDFATNTVRGRLRTFVNTGMARSGSKALTMDQAPFNSAYTSDSLTGTYNLQLYDLTAVQLRYDFYYKNHSQKSRPGNKVWMRGSETSPWIEAYDLYANQSPNGQWKFASININDVLGNAVPPQGLSSSFQIRFGQEGQASATNVVATNNYEDGYTFDDLWLTDAVNDIALLNIVTPAKKDCELGNSTPVAITVKNYSGSAQNNIPVSYRLNGGTVVTEVIPTLNPNQTLTYTFTAQANTSVLGQYNFEFWTGHAPDTYRSNDSILNYSFFKSPLINSFPYYEGFESNNGNWYTNGFNSSWEWGAPDKTTIAKAANGNKAWVTSLTERYKDNEYSNLVSPCFDISGMAQPVLSFSHIFEIEDDCDCDYTWVEYSIDGGENWQRLGLPGNGTNWYDNSTAVAWQVSQKKWHVASYDLPPGNYKIKFRFVMFGDAGVNFEGVGIDDVHLFDKAAIYAGPVSIGGTVQTVNGNDWVHFNDATGKRIASIHPQGQNLGSTTVQVHPYTGQVRFANQQYYANRNIVVQPTAQPSAPVRVRFYFTDTEAKALLAATGCGGCTPLNDPYELGVTQYTGPATEENGTLSDNAAGTYRFLLPDTVAIIPYDNGYFAEYNVDAFSEFWLGKGSIAPPAANSCTGDTLVYTAASSGSSYQWQVDNGSGFTTLTNNGNYSGATAPALRIVGLPTSSSGWRYRCVVDGVPGNAVTLRFTRIWNGSSSNDWANTANWGCGALPDAFTDVLIPGGLDNYPLVTVNAAIRQLRVSPGATVNVAAGVVLEVKGR